MPFTFAHPALIIPLRKFAPRFFSMTGLIVGSMVPDCEYFLRMKIKSTISHTTFGLITFDLPLGILLVFLIHVPVKRPLLNALPKSWRQRLQTSARLDWKQHWQQHYLAILISLLIGAASHLLWDAFTHESGFFVQRIPELQSSQVFFGHNFPTYKILQHTSTLLGLTVLAVLFFRMPKEVPTAPRATSNFLTAVIPVAFVVFSLRFATAGFLLKTGDCIVSLIASALCSILLVSVLNYVWIRAATKNKP